jgi:hypothetical protein
MKSTIRKALILLTGFVVLGVAGRAALAGANGPTVPGITFHSMTSGPQLVGYNWTAGRNSGAAGWVAGNFQTFTTGLYADTNVRGMMSGGDFCYLVLADQSGNAVYTSAPKYATGTNSWQTLTFNGYFPPTNQTALSVVCYINNGSVIGSAWQTN